mgnify:CR=1 FL=1
MKRTLFALFIILSLLFSGCAGSQATQAPTAQPAATQPQVAEPTTTAPTPEVLVVPVGDTATPDTGTPVATATSLPKAEMPKPLIPPLPAEPQRVEFQASDGANLVGMYYPAAVNPAPVVVLMHWAGGDKNDWVYVGMAAWLQNRGLEVPAAASNMAFDTPYAFQALPEELSFGVFAFDFRSYGESEAVSTSYAERGPLWVLDAQAAYAIARTLEGADPERITGIGASIGADAVVDGCGEGCLGALSLSPGNYLGVAYSEAVQALDSLSKPVWCVATEEDSEAEPTCRAAQGEHYAMQIYATGGHAMTMFRASYALQPPIEQVIQDFLKLVFELK